MSKTRKILIVVCSVIFIIGLILVLTGTADVFDNAVMRLVTKSGLIENKFLYRYFKFFTDIGEASIVIVIVALFLIFPLTTKKIGVALAPTMIASWVSNELIKKIIARARPVDRVLEVSSFSFPSGHAMNSTALYMSIMFLVLPLCRKKWQKIALVIACIWFSVSVSISRLYFNVHFVSDIVCGFSLGMIYAIIGTQIYQNILNKKKKVEEK